MTKINAIPLPDDDDVLWDNRTLFRAFRSWLAKPHNNGLLSREQAMAVRPMMVDLESGRLVLEFAPPDSDTRNDKGRSNCYLDKEGRLVIDLHATFKPAFIGATVVDTLSLYAAMYKKPKYSPFKICRPA